MNELDFRCEQYTFAFMDASEQLERRKVQKLDAFSKELALRVFNNSMNKRMGHKFTFDEFSSNKISTLIFEHSLHRQNKNFIKSVDCSLKDFLIYVGLLA